MKRKTFISIITSLILLVSLAFTYVLESYKVDPSSSTLKWTGSKIIGDSHTGNIQLKSGELLIESEKLKGGSFVIDMTTITNTDVSDKNSNKKLVDHLNSDDFFSVKKYFEATFKITSFVDQGEQNYTVNGDLTIKGKTEPINFPAIVVVEDNIVTAQATITFDRSKFDVRYGSGSFFDNLGNKAISDEIILEVNLVAKK